MPNFTKEVNDYENEHSDVKCKLISGCVKRKDDPEMKRVDVYQDLHDD